MATSSEHGDAAMPIVREEPDSTDDAYRRQLLQLTYAAMNDWASKHIITITQIAYTELDIRSNPTDPCSHLAVLTLIPQDSPNGFFRIESIRTEAAETICARLGWPWIENPDRIAARRSRGCLTVCAVLEMGSANMVLPCEVPQYVLEKDTPSSDELPVDEVLDRLIALVNDGPDDAQ
ncbi:hypothetical protein G7K_1137-t1 [Saitoella complicata NRRL Y-17804]|uniref:Uncharacterized protein n=2 Tax=Saitoella complicata (strain BCRC 22490 / CBS 7301 / JCM 7358 / NBRC 10748 / NRRL Y-17804) TaxID=698492 RepID=A0A0E9NAS1_SAICN|nr:hypothetical protein G7K_1137-t1 [Saitoella complicata NRRL Y-17804]